MMSSFTNEEYKDWRRDNLEKVRAYQRRYHAEMRKDPRKRIERNLRTRVYEVLKGISKAGHTFELLGCPVIDLKAHLESKFQPGMTWGNYGEWHIDHIRPCALFNLVDPKQQRLCFHYTNLQPLWAEDNIRKGKNFG